MRIAILGASRGCGKEFLLQAVESHEITILARNPDNLDFDASIKEKIHIVKGDVRNLQDVKNVVQNQDVVISSIGSAVKFNLLHPSQSVLDGTICQEAMKNIVEAMESQPSQARLIVVSSMGIGKDSEDEVPFLLKYFYHVVLEKPHKDKDIMEKIVEQSSLKSWILARPALLADGKKTGKYRVEVSGSGYTISRADVADFMLKNIDSNEWIGKKPVIAY